MEKDRKIFQYCRPNIAMSRKKSANSEVFKLAVLGDRRCGKATLIHRLLGNGYVEDLKPTIYDYSEKAVRFNDVCNKNIQIVDTSDLHLYPPMKKVTLGMAEAFILVFAINDVTSFRRLSEYYDDIMEIKSRAGSHQVPFIVVGNKVDLEQERQVEMDEVEDLVVWKWKRKFVEVCLRDGTNYDMLLKNLEEEIVKVIGPLRTTVRKKSLLTRLKSVF